MTVFTRQIATATRLIAKNGISCIWRSLPDAVAPDVSMPWLVNPGVPTDTAVKIVLLPFTRMNYEFIQSLVGTEIQVGDDYGLMAQVPFVPSNSDVVVMPDGTIRRLYKISPLQPDGTPIIYTLWFKT